LARSGRSVIHLEFPLENQVKIDYIQYSLFSHPLFLSTKRNILPVSFVYMQRKELHSVSLNSGNRYQILIHKIQVLVFHPPSLPCGRRKLLLHIEGTSTSIQDLITLNPSFLVCKDRRPSILGGDSVGGFRERQLVIYECDVLRCKGDI